MVRHSSWRQGNTVGDGTTPPLTHTYGRITIQKENSILQDNPGGPGGIGTIAEVLADINWCALNQEDTATIGLTVPLPVIWAYPTLQANVGQTGLGPIGI